MVTGGLLLSALAPGRASGSFMGLVLTIVIAVGIGKCVAIARRATTNTKCVLALLFALIVLFQGAVLALGWRFELWDGLPPALLVLILLLRGILIVVAATMAVLGLLELRARPGVYRQGRKQAVWALVFVTLFAGSFVWTTLKRGRADAVHSPAPVAGKRTHTSEEFNFEVTASGAWVPVDARNLSPLAELLLTRAQPQVNFGVVPERVGVDAGITCEALAEVVHARLRSGSPSVQLGAWVEETVDGIPGLRATSRARIGRQEGIFDQWVGVRGGFAYQLPCWSAAHALSRDELEKVANEVRRGFRQIDPERVIHTSGPRAPAEWTSVRFGTRLRLQGDWFLWDTLGTDVPDAAFGVLGADNALVVVPIALGEPAVDARLIADALLGCVFDDASDGALSRPHPIQRGELKGYAFDLEAENDDGSRYRYRIWCLVGERTAHLVAVWAPAGRYPDAELDAWLDGFSANPEFQPLFERFWTDSERRRHAGVYSRIARQLADGRPSDAITYLRLAVAVWPADPDLHAMLMLALLSAGRYEDILRATEQALALHPGNQMLQSFRPFARAHLGEKEAALEEFESLFRAGYRDIHDLTFCADLLGELGRGDEALGLIERVLAGGSSTPIRILLARRLAQADDVERAIEELRDERARRPFDLALEWALIEIYEGAGRHREAREIAQRLIEHGRDSAQARYHKARAETELGWYRQAKETLQAACERYGTDEDLQGLLEHVNGLLGEGSNRLLREAIEPVAIPAAVLAPPPPGGVIPEGRDAIYEHHVVACALGSDHSYRKTHYERVRVLTPEGASAFSSLRFTFDPLAESVHVNRLVVRNAAGRETARGKLSDYYVLDEPPAGVASQDKCVQIPVPGLALDHTVEVVITVRRLSPVEAMPYEAVKLSLSHPVVRSAVVVRGDPGAIAHWASPGLEVGADGEARWWSLSRPPVVLAEPYQPEYERYLPRVCLGHPNTSWAQVARRYQVELDTKLEDHEAVSAAAERAVDGLETDEEKTLALARFVQGEVTYQAIEFGSRARIPNPAQETLEKRYGDCKDHAVLLHQLLKAVGIRSHLALVSVSSPIVDSLPSLDQFDHMVVHCPDLDGGRYIDCTDEYLDLRLPVPVGLAGRRTLVLAGDRPALRSIPAYPPGSSCISSDREINLALDGSARVKETVAYDGYIASFLRGYLAGEAADQRQRLLQRDLSRVLPGVHVRALRVDGLEARSAPLVLGYEYTVPDVLQESGDRWVGRVPAGWERYYLALERNEGRRAPFVIPYPDRFDSRIVVHAPSGLRLASRKVPPETATSGPYGAFRASSAGDDTSLRVQARLERTAGTFEPAAYAPHVAFFEHALDTLAPTFVLER